MSSPISPPPPLPINSLHLLIPISALSSLLPSQQPERALCIQESDHTACIWNQLLDTTILENWLAVSIQAEHRSLLWLLWLHYGFSWWQSGKEHTCQCRRCGFNPWVREIPWRRKWQPTPVILPGRSHAQRILVGYSLWGRKIIWHNLATKQQQQHDSLITRLGTDPMGHKCIIH